MTKTNLPISIPARIQKVGGQLFIENTNISFRDLSAWWDNDAEKDEVKSATGISKALAKSSFTKLPALPKENEVRNKIILDLGCGYGRTLIPLAKYHPKLAIGIDISSVMLSKCLSYAEGARCKKLVLIHSGFPPIPLKDGSIDLIYSCAVLLHLTKEQIPSLMREMIRILKPGGKIILQSSFPNSLSIKGLSNWLPSKLKSQLTGEEIIPGMPKHYSRWELEKTLRSFGLSWIIKPRDYELIPTNINRFGLPCRGQLKKINTWFEDRISDKQNLIINSFLPMFFDVELTKKR